MTIFHLIFSREPFFIRFGEHNFELDQGSASPFNVNYEKNIIHPEYKLNQGHHDLALIKLAHPISITVCI